MFIKQLSVFIENREGRLEEVLKTLKEKDINIVSLSLADSSDYGMLRMVVANPERALSALKESGFSAMLTDVLAVKLDHKAGQLQEVLDIVCKAGINVEYMYALATASDDASIVFKASLPDKAVELLEKEGAKFLSAADIAAI